MEKKVEAYLLETLEKMMAIDSPSGYNHEIQAFLVSELEGMGYRPQLLHKGGVYADLGGKGDPLMLFAHVDTLGAVVSYVKPNGRLALSRIGGLNANNVETEHVRVITRFNGTFDGTIQLENASVHVNKDYDTKQRSFETQTVEVVLDENVKSAEDVNKLGIYASDLVAVEPRFTVTKSGYVKSRFLDDKASAAVLLAYAKHLKDENITPSRNVWINFTMYEEIGHGGALGIPDGIGEVIAVDMGCVGDNLTCTERMVSICGKDGGGAYNRDVTNALVKTAMDNGIAYAVDVYNYYGSDVEVSLRAGYDVRHGLIGPGVYASHGYERTHVEGLSATFDLLKAYIK